jgi:hypothetical protein
MRLASKFLSDLGLNLSEVCHLEFRTLPRFPEARLQAPTVPIENVHRLCARLPTRGCPERCYM